ncbi:MAG: TetR/AcrR family transcriptional regulator [Syntrophales bacterium]|nr:TetR/AcrR family transcriptional regulator [Syntrophales bacterium]
MEKLKRKEREYNLRRAEILKEAEKIFAAKGFYKTTMAEIAEASGFAIGTLYQFFEGKERLYTTMVSEKLDMMYSEIREKVGSAESIIEKIEALVKAHFAFVENNVNFCTLFIQWEGTAISEGNTFLKDKMISSYLGHINFVEELMQEGTRAGYLKVMEQGTMAFALLGMINSFTFNWLVAPKDTHLSGKVGFVLDIFLSGVKNEGGQGDQGSGIRV